MKTLNRAALAIAAIALADCSEPSMFERCVNKEMDDMAQMSSAMRTELGRQHGSPYYDEEIASLASQYIVTSTKNEIQRIEAVIAKYQSDSK